MTIRTRVAVFFFLLAVGSLPPLAAAGTAAIGGMAPERSMNFALVRNGNCQQTCIQWISAEGKITTDTPNLLANLLRSLHGRKLPVVIQSFGGDVDAALAIGHLIRAAGLETAVGRTRLDGCPMLEPRCQQKIVRDGWSEGEARTEGAYCFSACPFAFAGGKARAAAVDTEIGVHQITTVYRTFKRAEAGQRIAHETKSAKLSSALRKGLSTYFDEMGISREVFAMMALATPQGMYNIQNAEALKSGVITEVFSYDDEPGYVICGPDAKPDAPCHTEKSGELMKAAVLTN
jgi:hypothetical protein